MSYFRELPDLEIPSFLPHKKSSRDYVRVKNLFRRVKFLDWLQDKAVLYTKFQIPINGRPDTVADLLYGSPDYDWVVLITAGIINVRDQWPLSERDIYRFSSNKYGEEGLTSIKYYETVEVRDSDNRLVLPAGKIVDPDFTLPDPDDKLATLNPITAVTNYEHEVRLNEKKRSIRLLEPLYLQQFLNDVREIMIYSKSSEFVNINLIRTDNMKVKSP